MTADHFPPPSAFPTPSTEVALINSDDPFNPRRKSLTSTAPHQENIPPFPLHPRSMTVPADSKSHSNFDDDAEVTKNLSDENRNGSSSAMPRPTRGPKSMVRKLSNSSFNEKLHLKKSNSDIFCVRTNFSKKFFQIRCPIFERFRSLWKISSLNSSIQTETLIERKTSWGFFTKNLLENNSSIDSFYTADETFSNCSFDEVFLHLLQQLKSSSSM